MIQIEATSARAAKAILSRIDLMYGLVWSQDGKSVHGSAISAKIIPETNIVEIRSNYYTQYTISHLAEEVKGQGVVLN